MKNAISIKELNGKVVMTEIYDPYFSKSEDSDKKLTYPTFEFSEAYEDILLKLTDSMKTFEDMSTGWDHPFTFEDMIEKAKRRVSWIPSKWEAY